MGKFDFYLPDKADKKNKGSALSQAMKWQISNPGMMPTGTKIGGTILNALFEDRNFRDMIMTSIINGVNKLTFKKSFYHDKVNMSEEEFAEYEDYAEDEYLDGYFSALDDLFSEENFGIVEEKANDRFRRALGFGSLNRDKKKPSFPKFDRKKYESIMEKRNKFKSAAKASASMMHKRSKTLLPKAKHNY